MTGTKRSGIVYEDSKQSIQRTQKRDTRCGIALLTIQLLPEEENGSEPADVLQDVVGDACLLNDVVMEISFALQTGEGDGWL